MTAASTTSLEGFHSTATAERADRLVRGFFDAVNAGDDAGIDGALARGFLSYDKHGVRSRTGIKRYYSELKQSFSDMRFEVHENIGVLVEGDLVALRTIEERLGRDADWKRQTRRLDDPRLLPDRGRADRGALGVGRLDQRLPVLWTAE